MTRDEAIEAMARAIEPRLVCHDGEKCEADFLGVGIGYSPCQCRERMAAAGLDAIGWRDESVVKAEALRVAADAIMVDAAYLAPVAREASQAAAWMLRDLADEHERDPA